MRTWGQLLPLRLLHRLQRVGHGPKAGNNWFSQGLVRAGKPVVSLTDPGKRGIGHQWAYLPDVAETMVRLLEKFDVLEKLRSSTWKAIGMQMGRR